MPAIVPDPIAPLIPWYAAGSLDPADSARVETHISACDACRDLLAVARGFRRLAPHVGPETLLEHVQSQRLVEFADDPASLEPETRRFITSHIRACAVCAEALEILEDLGRAPAADDRGLTPEAAALRSIGKTRRAWIDLWRWMSRTVLRPAPALAYLAAFLTVLLLTPLRPPAPPTGGEAPRAPVTVPPQPGSGSRPPVSLVPPRIELPEEIVFRGTGQPPPPLAVPLRPGAEGVAFELVTSIDSEDLRDPATTFRVEIVQGDRLVFEATRRGTDFDRRGRLTLLLDPGAIAAAVPCRVRLVLVKPGDPLDGEEVYRRSFLLVPDGAPPR